MGVPCSKNSTFVPTLSAPQYEEPDEVTPTKQNTTQDFSPVQVSLQLATFSATDASLRDTSPRDDALQLPTLIVESTLVLTLSAPQHEESDEDTPTKQNTKQDFSPVQLSLQLATFSATDASLREASPHDDALQLSTPKVPNGHLRVSTLLEPCKKGCKSRLKEFVSDIRAKSSSSNSSSCGTQSNSSSPAVSRGSSARRRQVTFDESSLVFSGDLSGSNFYQTITDSRVRHKSQIARVVHHK